MEYLEEINIHQPVKMWLRHLANKIGNLERPFLKEFFPRCVESYGCLVLRMGLSYNKWRNIIESVVLRGCTSNMSSNSNTVVVLVGGNELHLLPMSTGDKQNQLPCFWGFNVVSGLYGSFLGMIKC